MKKKYGHFSSSSPNIHGPFGILFRRILIHSTVNPLPSYRPISSVIELAFAGDSGFIVVSNYVQSDVVSYILCRADVAFSIQQIQQ